MRKVRAFTLIELLVVIAIIAILLSVLLPHRKNAQEPLGVNALFADGHVNFCTGPKVFDEQLWNPQGNWVWDQGPGNNRAEFEEILRRLSGF